MICRFLHRLCGAAIVFACITIVDPALAQKFPERPVTLICPWPPGGGSRADC